MPRDRRLRLHALVLLLATLPGCGTAPSTSKLLRRAPVDAPPPRVAPAPIVPQLPAPGLPGASPAGNLDAMLAEVGRINMQHPGFVASFSVYEKAPSREERETLDIAFKRPQTLKLHIVHSSTESSGARVLWTGGDEMKVRPSWLPIPVTMRYDDERLKTWNGWTIKDTQPRAILAVLLDPQAERKVLGDATVGGKPHLMVSVRSAKSPQGVTREVIGIDRTTQMPTYREMYRNETLVYKLEARSLNLKTPSSSELSL